MKHIFFKKPARIRKAARGGKEVTIPPETKFVVGEEVIEFYNDSVLIVPKWIEVDEELLRQAIGAGH